jgi:chromosome segregation ATPase
VSGGSDDDSQWLQFLGLGAIFVLIKKTGDQIMAKLDEIKAQIAQANEATNNIAEDINLLKQKLDAAIANSDGALQSQLQEVSDALAPLVTRLQDVAGQTPPE